MIWTPHTPDTSLPIMKISSRRSSDTAVLPRPSLLLPNTFAFGVLLAGCLSDSGAARISSPPSGSNNTVLNWETVAVGGTMNCLLTTSGRALCWGNGVLGDGTTTSSDRLVKVRGSFLFFDELRIAGGGACGLSTGGVAFCWGNNVGGRLGNGTTEPSAVPVPADTPVRFSTITAEGQSTCAVALSGDAYCWGTNLEGELGFASGDTISLVPEPVVGGLKFTRIALALGHTCALTSEGAPYCWGRHWGQTPQPVPTSVRFHTLDAGSSTFCGLTDEGAVWCWGSNRDGVFGNGERDDPAAPEVYRAVPTRVVTDLRFSKLSVGDRHICGIETEREEAYCWGRDDTGQLGDGTPQSGTDTEFKLSPSRVRLSRRFTDIGADLGTSCGVTTELKAYCWGLRTGNLATPTSDVPVEVG